MPLKAGKKAFKSNIKELVHKYESTGKIGTSKPKSKRKAIKQAVAIAYDVKRKGRCQVMQNKGTFSIPGGGNKDRGLTKVHYHPGINQQYIQDMLGSQKNQESRTVTEAEEETMFNRIFNADYRNLREKR